MSASGSSAFVDSVVRASDTFARERSQGEPVWLEEFRREALAAFADHGLPTTRDEEWRYTSIQSLARSEARVAAEAAVPDVGFGVAASLAPNLELSRRLVFVDGRFAPGLSTDLGDDCRTLAVLRTGTVDDAARAILTDPEPVKRSAFSALAAAFADDGLLLRVPTNTLLAETIHVVFISTGAADGVRVSHPLVRVVVDSGARASVVQEHVSLGSGARLANATVHLAVAPNAELDHVTIQRESDEAAIVSNLDARVERDARLRCHVVTTGGSLVRNDARIVLADTGADATLNGLFLGAGKRHVDNHTTVDHAMPHGTSRELYKGILRDESRGVFRGRVIVRPDAQHTNALQSNPNLLLGENAEIDTKPQLEIYADDVKCSHGSTVGQMDPDALFYLRARGLGDAEARGMLTQGFASEVIDELPHEGLRERLREEILFALERPLETPTP